MTDTLPAGSASLAGARAPQDRALALLAAGVPLSLLLDLITPPDSAALLRDEPGDTTWLRCATA